MTCIIGTKKITVVDNFLPDYLFTKLSKYLLSNRIFWVYGKQKVYKEDDDLENYQMVHSFQNAIDAQQSNDLPKLKFFMNKLNIQGLCRINANLEGYRGKQQYPSGFHVDLEKEFIPTITNEGFVHKSINEMTTGIYYVNTCNGYTEFEDGTIVNSVGNRFVSFPANTKHRGVSQTDTKARVVINFNYW